MVRKLLCVLLILAIPCLSFAEEDWANAVLPKDRLPEYIKTVPWDEIPAPSLGQHHYLLLCIDQWKSKPRPEGIDPPVSADGERLDFYGNTDGMVILTLDTAAHRVCLASIVRDAAILKPTSTEDHQYYGRINYVYNDYGPEALCRLISEHLGIRIEKYILFNFSQIQDIIDLPGLDGVDIELNENEISYLARFAVPKHSVTEAGGYYALQGDPLVFSYVQSDGRKLDFSVPASLFTQTDNGMVKETCSIEGTGGALLTFSAKTGACSLSLNGQALESGFYSYEHGRLALMFGADVWHNSLAPAGLYHLKGHSALLYMRIRKSSKKDTDFMRTQRVRNVLSALAGKCRSFSLDQANDLANSIMQHNDATNMSLKEMTDAASLAYALRDCTIEEFRVPAQEDVRSITFGNMSALEIHWSSVREKYLDFLDHTVLTRDLDFVVDDSDDE